MIDVKNMTPAEVAAKWNDANLLFDIVLKLEEDFKWQETALVERCFNTKKKENKYGYHSYLLVVSMTELPPKYLDGIKLGFQNPENVEFGFYYIEENHYIYAVDYWVK